MLSLRLLMRYFLHVYKDRKNSILDEKDDTDIASIFQSFFVLKMPTVCITPSLEEIQKYTNQCVNEIVSVLKGVFKWDPIFTKYFNSSN